MKNTAIIGAGVLALGLFLILKKSQSGTQATVSARFGGGWLGDAADVIDTMHGGSEMFDLGALTRADLDALVGQIHTWYPFLQVVPRELVYGVAMTESGLNPLARGSSGEYGLMQIMPTTWSWIVNRYGSPPGEWTDPYSNILVGMLVLYDYNQQLGGDWGATVTAYNVGVQGYLSGRRNDEYAGKVLSHMGAA